MRQGAFQQERCARRTGAGRHRRRRPVVAVALAVLALTGCTGPDAQPDPLPTDAVTTSPPVTPTPSPTPTPEPVTAPERPPEMDQPDEAGAIAAAEYVLRVAHYAVASGDLAEWDRLTTSDCGFCANIRDWVTDVYGGGGRMDGGAFEFGDASVVATDPSMAIFAVDLVYSSAAVRQYDAEDLLVTEEPAGEGVFTVEVVPTPQGWRLLGAAARSGEEE